jgi:ribosomal protein S15P/S13E
MTDVEEAQRNSIHEEEIRGQWFDMSNERTKSNGHDKSKEESMNLMETIKNLQKYVQSHKADNERLRTTKEQQDDSTSSCYET